VNARRIGPGSAPEIALHPTGGFLVTWANGACTGRLGRRYDGAGLAVGAEFIVDACAR